MQTEETKIGRSGPTRSERYTSSCDEIYARSISRYSLTTLSSWPNALSEKSLLPLKGSLLSRLSSIHIHP
jgi:hypothetical protein